jgi:hypothetical protein
MPMAFLSATSTAKMNLFCHEEHPAQVVLEEVR